MTTSSLVPADSWYHTTCMSSHRISLPVSLMIRCRSDKTARLKYARMARLQLPNFLAGVARASLYGVAQLRVAISPFLHFLPDCLHGLLPGTVSSKLLGRYLFLVFPYFFVSVPNARLSWPSRQLLSARKYIISHRM